MKTLYIDKKIKYDGSQLRSHWIFENTKILDDAIVAFCGPADVSLKYMVDLVDVHNKEGIYSNLMLHFIAEHFEMDLKSTIFAQRLLCSIVADELRAMTGVYNIKRTGDDIFDGDKKLSVSIATKSPVSSLIHFGININSKGTPVATKGLDDYNVNVVDFAGIILKRYSDEIFSAGIAQRKVRAVL